MARFKGIYEFRHDRIPKVGILLINLGTPDEPTKPALRRYLKEFLMDPRVVEIPRPIWALILNLIILNVRPKKSAALYQSVWMDDGSPLMVHSRAQEKAVRKKLEELYPGRTEVALGMRYGEPSISSALEELKDSGCDRLIILPLYPQYSGTTTASAFDAVADELKQWRWVPELRFIAQYHDNPGYIVAMAEHIRAYWAANGRSKFLLFSYHGIPKRNFMLGDPYHCQCHKTSRLLADELGLRDGEWQSSFQSRFGKQEWLKPYTETTLKTLPKEGTTEVDVFCPGFPADCLETLEEIGEENKAYFLQAGGKEYRYIPALNATQPHIEALVDVIWEAGQGFPEFSDTDTLAKAKKRAKKTLERALEKGAEE